MFRVDPKTVTRWAKAGKLTIRSQIQTGDEFEELSHAFNRMLHNLVAMQQRLNELAKGGTKPLFLEAQFKVIMKNMQGEPVMPTDEGFYSDDDADATPPKIGTAH